MSRRRPTRKRRRGLPRPAGIAIVAFVALLIVGGLALIGFRVARSGSLPNIELAGADVGELEERDLRRAVRKIEGSLRTDRIDLERPAAGRARAATTSTTGEDIGYTIDVNETVEEILERGRQGNPLAALLDQLRATFATIDMHHIDDIDSGVVADTVGPELGSDAFLGGVRFEGRKVTPRYPRPGVIVDRDELEEELIEAVREPGSDEITIEGRPVSPTTDEGDVDALVGEAERAVDGRVTLTKGPRKVVLSPDDLGDIMRTTTADGGSPLTLTIRPRALTRAADLDSLETPPVDATFEVSGGEISIVPAEAGVQIVAEQVAEQVLDLALKDGPASAPVKGAREKADFTTADARELRIKERVSSFTTYHSCCEPRVDNIHRIADLVDGVIVEPGDSLSLNDHVGPRTTSNGFVGAPAIRDGEFVEEVGGGISQFATTHFNAIFYGGYDFLEYQPHSYYISRYPPGREATISTPGPDLAFLNDSDAGVYIDTSYTEESITVTFYGNQDFDVDAVAGPQKNVTPPKEECRVNENLARGEESVVQEGITGFDIVVRRVFSDGRPDETFTTHYNMQPRIVEKRTCDEKRKRKKN